VKDVVIIDVADLANGLAGDLVEIELGRGGDFTAHDDKVGLGVGLASHAAGLVLARQASRTASEIVSQTLSGWPSPTDSEEKMKFLLMMCVIKTVILTYQDKMIYRLHRAVNPRNDFYERHAEISARPVGSHTLRIVALLENRRIICPRAPGSYPDGQSRISTHLGLLQDSGLVESRREGKRTFYKAAPQSQGNWRDRNLCVGDSRAQANFREHPAIRSISSACSVCAGGAGPGLFQPSGRAVRPGVRAGPFVAGFGHLLLRILPPLVVADLGSGEGLISELLARRCKQGDRGR
jgi:DNA-binding transcriptional ArsR family regulator